MNARVTASARDGQVMDRWSYLKVDRVPVYVDGLVEEVRPHRGPVHVGEAVIHVPVQEGGFSHPVSTHTYTSSNLSSLLTKTFRIHIDTGFTFLFHCFGHFFLQIFLSV